MMRSNILLKKESFAKRNLTENMLTQFSDDVSDTHMYVAECGASSETM